MTHALLLVCGIVCANALGSVAGLTAAARCGVPMTLSRGAGLWVLIGATACECLAFSMRHAGGSVLLVPAFASVIAGAACDAACGYVFDAVTLPALALLLGIAAGFHALVPCVAGIGLAGGSMMLLHVVTRGRGLGLGDVKLAACIGAGAGAARALTALGAAFVLGAACAAVLLVCKRAGRRSEMRFAPYLAAGMLVAVSSGVVL